MKKSLYFIVIGLSAAAAFSACTSDDEFLTEKPKNIYTIETAFNKSTQIDAVLASTYNKFIDLNTWGEWEWSNSTDNGSATGTTKGVAEKIAAVTGGNLYEILAAEAYTADDLNYNNRSSRATSEQNDKSVRPQIGSEELSLEGYTTIYLGFPIWWGEEPRILDTFVEKYNFEGITVIPFCTSGSSGIGRSGSNMEALAGSGTWLEGKRFSGRVSEKELQSWIDGLK